VRGTTFAVIHPQEDKAREQELRTYTVGTKTSPQRGKNGRPYAKMTVRKLRLKACLPQFNTLSEPLKEIGELLDKVLPASG
jgi:hypothetical protein